MNNKVRNIGIILIIISPGLVKEFEIYLEYNGILIKVFLKDHGEIA